MLKLFSFRALFPSFSALRPKNYIKIRAMVSGVEAGERERAPTPTPPHDCMYFQRLCNWRWNKEPQSALGGNHRSHVQLQLRAHNEFFSPYFPSSMTVHVLFICFPSPLSCYLPEAQQRTAWSGSANIGEVGRSESWRCASHMLAVWGDGKRSLGTKKKKKKLQGSKRCGAEGIETKQSCMMKSLGEKEASELEVKTFAWLEPIDKSPSASSLRSETFSAKLSLAATINTAEPRWRNEAKSVRKRAFWPRQMLLIFSYDFVGFFSFLLRFFKKAKAKKKRNPFCGQHRGKLRERV